MSRRNALLLTCSLAVAAWFVVSCSNSPKNAAFDHLDALIDRQDEFISAKQQAIDEVRMRLNDPKTAADPLAQYDVNKLLYDQYIEFQNDSAMQYATRNIALASQLADDSRRTDSQLDLMHALTKSYLLDETETMAERLDTTAMSQQQLLYYYKILSDICLFKVEFHKGNPYEAEYQRSLTNYRRQIARLAESGSEINLLYQANYLNDTGNTDEAIALLEHQLERYHSGERMFSIITSTLAFYYSEKGNRDEQKRLLAMSAASDIEGCIMENSALRQLADILFDDGDIDRAYRYINLSVADATFYGTRLRNLQASQLVPRIIKAYQEKQEKNYNQLRNMAIALSLVALLLVVVTIAIAILLKRYRRLSNSRKAINEQLNETVALLEQSNSQLRERDKIKEQYLGRFLALSSALIDEGEKQRKAMKRLDVENKSKELSALLKSPHFYYENTKLFYENFDAAFLNIYPRFIDGVNSLLQPVAHITTKEELQLTRELRILALIRLGITDNHEIASILRSSITTIYTYRSRLKAKALNKDTFEDDVKHLQSNA